MRVPVAPCEDGSRVAGECVSVKYPMLYIFSTCRAFLRTVPLLLYSRTEPENLDTSMEDHVADECRYFCMSRPIPPRRRETGARPANDPLDLSAQARPM